MRFEDIKRLLNGEEVEVLNGKGTIQIDLECNMFLAIVKFENDSMSLDLHDTIEEAIDQIRNWK